MIKNECFMCRKAGGSGYYNFVCVHPRLASPWTGLQGIHNDDNARYLDILNRPKTSDKSSVVCMRTCIQLELLFNASEIENFIFCIFLIGN